MKTVSREELVGMMSQGTVLVVNVLAKEGYDSLHIRGSVSIPRSDLERGGWEKLDPAKTVVVHCSSYSCAASRLAAEFLESKGFDARAYEGGIIEWAEAGLPTEGKMTPSEFLERRYTRVADGPSHKNLRPVS